MNGFGAQQQNSYGNGGAGYGQQQSYNGWNSMQK
jgi:hypothetical protein